MLNEDDSLADAIKGIYSTAKPNADIPLYSGPIVIEDGGERIQATGDVFFGWQPFACPEARIFFEATAEQCRRFAYLPGLRH